MSELDDKNPSHSLAKKKLLEFACNPKRVPITRTAERDLSITSVRRLGVIEAIRCHIEDDKPILIEKFDSGETAYVFKDCCVETEVLYVKVKFCGVDANEQMLIVSAHPDRRW